MKTKSALRRFLSIASSAVLTISYTHAASTGFNLDTAGPHDYDTATNWVSSTINGTWNSDLTLTADQTVTFGADTVLSTGWAFNYGGNFGLTLRGTGANRTVTLGGDISVNPVADQTITIGTGTANQNLNVNLGGVTRTATVSANKGLTFVNVLSNGGLTKTGAGLLTLSSNASTYAGQLTVANGTLSIASINNVSANGMLGNSALSVILGSSGGNTGTLKYTAASGSSTKRFTFAAGGTGEINLPTALTISGLLDGTGNLLKTGNGTLTLSGATAAQSPTFSGTIQITAGKIALPQAGGNVAATWTGSVWTSVYDTTGTAGAGVGIDLNSATTTVALGGLAGNVDISSAIEGNWSTTPKLVLNPQQGVSVSYSGIISNGLGTGMTFDKIGRGTQTLTGSNSYSGATTVWAGTLALAGASGTALNSAFTVRGGILLLDNSAALADRLNDTTALSLGSLTLKSNTAAGTQSETVGNTTFAVGGKVTVDLNGGTAQTTLALGAVTRSAGAAIDFVGVGGTLGGGLNSPNVTTTGTFPGGSNNILPWATVNGTTWAGTASTTSIVAYAGAFVDPTSAASNAADNAQLTGSGTMNAVKSFNSLNVISSGASQSFDLSTAGVLTLTSGAILKSGTDAYTISGSATNAITSGTELIAHVDGGALTISAKLNNAIVGIAKGGTGDLIISGTHGNFSGNTSIAGGQLELQGAGFTMNGLVTGAGGLTVNLNAGQTLTLGNNSNSYSGQTIVKGGYLSFNSYNNIGLPGGFTGGSWLGSSNTSLAASNVKLDGGIFYATYTFDKDLGDGPNQIQITGGTSGFVNTANSGGAASFELDNGKEIVWGSTYFNPSVFVFSQNNGANLQSTMANGIDLNGATRTIMVGDATYNSNVATAGSVLSGVIRTSSGTAGLTKTGIGRLILSGTNTYNGNTTVSQGVLQPNTVASLPGYDSPGKVVFNGGTVSPLLGSSGWTTAQVDTLLSNATKTSGNLGFGFDSTSLSLSQWSAFTSGTFGALGLAKSGTATLILNQTNTYTGGTTISGGTLIFQKLVSMPASGVVAVQTGGTLGIGLGGVGEWTTGVSGEGTLGGLLAGLGGQVGGTVSYAGNVGLDLVTTGTQSYGAIANLATSLALTKSGTGSLALTGTNAYTGATNLNGGSLILDYATTDNTKLANAAALNLNGGTLNLQGGGHLEVVSATNLNAGHTAITRNLGTAKLRMNALNRAAGGTISFADATIADTDRVNTNGILGGYATLGNDWATSAASGTDIAVTALAAYTGALPTTGGAAADNDTLTGGQTQAGATAANTVKITNTANSQTLDLGANNLTITSTAATTLGGILYAGGSDNLYSITGSGRIVSSGANQEIIFAVQTGTLTVSAPVAAASASSPVTKSGAGKLVLSSTSNSYTGATRVNEGTLAWGASNVFAVTPFSIGSATLDAATYDDTVGTLDVTANATINLGSGANLAFAASNAVDWTGGTLNLTGTLDFSGTATSSLRFGTSATGLTATQLASISASGWTNFALNSSGYLTATVDGGGSPEIALNQGGDIASGGSKGFGTVTLGSNTSLVFTITNSGTAALNLTGSPLVAVSGSDAADFTVTAVPTTPVTSGGGTTMFTVQFAPLGTTGGPRNALLTILNNDSDEGTFTINVSGTAQSPYEAWSGAADFNVDSNGDGVKNGLAFLLGATDKNVSALNKLPTVQQSGGSLVLTFQCLKDAYRGSASLNVEHSNNLGISDAWLAAPVTDAGSPLNNVSFSVSSFSTTLNNVTATVSNIEAASGKLFGRLKANNP